MSCEGGNLETHSLPPQGQETVSANQELLLLTHDVKDEHIVKGMTCMFKTWEAAWDYRQNYIMCHTILLYIRT